MKLQRTLAAWLFALLVWAPHATAQPGGDKSRPPDSAADDARARELFRRGDRLYDEGDYEGALRAFEKAYELSQRPALLFNLANTYERLGRYEDALKALQKFLPDAGTREVVVKKRIANLEERISELSKVDAKEDPAPAPAPEPDQAPEPQAEPAGDVPILGYVLLGVGAVGLGLGIGFTVDAMAARDEAETLCPESSGLRLCTPDAQEVLDRDLTSSFVADLSFSVGIAAAATGIVLVVLAAISDEEPAETSRVWATPRVGGGEVGFVSSF
jgi:tetratricopeptide (TPR) repeat protein